MKKALIVILAVLAVLLVGLYLVAEANGLSAEPILEIGGVVFLAVLVVYAWLYGGIRCPNCGCRVSSKYGRRSAFEGRFPCPKCGTMIEV